MDTGSCTLSDDLPEGTIDMFFFHQNETEVFSFGEDDDTELALADANFVRRHGSEFPSYGLLEADIDAAIGLPFEDNQVVLTPPPSILIEKSARPKRSVHTMRASTTPVPNFFQGSNVLFLLFVVNVLLKKIKYL